MVGGMMTTLGWLLTLSACLWVSDEEVTDRYDELTDADIDGFVGVAWGGDDCDDGAAAVNPGVTEEPYDGIDNDCDEQTPDDDVDGDGFILETDCNDEDASIYPGAEEVCDEVDQDCDDVADNGVQLTVYTDSDGDGYGDPALASAFCTLESGYSDNDLDCNDADAAISPDAVEICDELDNDCNELVDDDDTPTDPLTWYADSDGDGYGNALSTEDACVQPSDHVDDSSDCDDGDEAIFPGALETLGDSKDGDCDGEVDTFELALVDTRDSQYVRAANLSFVSAVGDDEIHLGWSSVSFDDGGGTQYDGMMVSTYSASVPLAGETDFYSHGSPSSLGVQGDAADFLASDGYFLWVRNFDGAAGRIVQVDGYDRYSEAQGSLDWQQAGLSTLFSDLQIGFSVSSNVSFIGCSDKGGGLEAGFIPIEDLLSETASSSSILHGFHSGEFSQSCEYDDGLAYIFWVGATDPGPETLEYWAWQEGSSEELDLTHFSTPMGYIWDVGPDGDYTVASQEIVWVDDRYSWVVAFDSPTDPPLLWMYWTDLGAEDPYDVLVANEFEPNEAFVEIDGAPTLDGEVVGCGIAESGTLYVYVADPGAGSYQPYEMSEAWAGADDCSVTVTEAGLMALSLIDGDDIWLGFVNLP